MTTHVDQVPSSDARAIRVALKAAIIDDAISLRAAKHVIRTRQQQSGPGAAAYEQARLVTQRLEARARLLVYGLLRGRTWQQIESRHASRTLAEATGDYARLVYVMTRIWNLVSAEPMPAEVTAALEAGRP